MSDHDLDTVITACHASRMEFMAHFGHTLNRDSVIYACGDREILARVISVLA